MEKLFFLAPSSDSVPRLTGDFDPGILAAMRPLRLVRLVRLCRVAGVMRELVILVDGMKRCAQVVRTAHPPVTLLFMRLTERSAWTECILAVGY